MATQLYNEEIKTEFLDSIDLGDGSIKTYTNTLRAANFTERILDKDLYDFTLSEIEDVINSKNPFKIETVKNHVSVIRRYIQWAIDKELRGNNTNPLHTVTDNWLESLVDKDRRIAYTMNEMKGFISKMVNAQDRAIFQLILNGAWGKAASEITDFTIHDIDADNNKITLGKGTDHERKVKVDEGVIKDLLDAHEQHMYIFNNGKKSAKMYRQEAQLKYSDYVLKNIISKREEQSEQVAKNTVYIRIRKVKESLKLEPLTAQTVRYTGMLYYANKYLETHDELDDKIIDWIGKRFGIHSSVATHTQSAKRIVVANTVNLENLERYYGESEEELEQVK